MSPSRLAAHQLASPLPLLALVGEVLRPGGHQAAQVVRQVGQGYRHTRGEEVEEAEGKTTDKEDEETS